jgi:uncharacterized membrane protein
MNNVKLARRLTTGVVLVLLTLVMLPGLGPARAQGPSSDTVPDLALFTSYPSEVIGVGDNLTYTLTLRTTNAPQVAELSIQDLPDGWTATLRGNNRLVESVYVQPDTDSTVDLRVDPPADVTSGTYTFSVQARSDQASADLPLTVTVQERVPARLVFSTDLPTVRGKPDTTFHYNVTLANQGDEDVTVNLLADASSAFSVTYKLSNQEVTNIPVEANSTKRLTVDVAPLSRTVAADDYPITLHAQGDSIEADLQLTAEVVGAEALNLTTSDGRLSGDAEIGSRTSYSLELQNTGTAPARGISVSATQPNGWTVELQPNTIDSLDAGQTAEITAYVQPADNAIAGDYMVTFRAQPEGGTQQSVEFRVTVRTSTLWGVAGVALIAIAVLVVSMAVMRFGRR